MKKIVFLASLIYLIYFVGIFVSGSICHSSWCRVRDDDFFGQIFFLFLSFLPVFFFSLITYKMRDEVFQAWWRFARFFVPIIIIVTYFLNASHQQSGFGGVAQGAFSFAILFVLYAIFIITSLVRIIFAYRRTK